MKRFISIGLVAISFWAALNGKGHASTIDISVTGLAVLSPDRIWSYQIEFFLTGSSTGIDVTFETARQHLWEVQPGTKILNWNLAWNVTDQSKLVILADDKSFGADSPLANGPLLSITGRLESRTPHMRWG